MLTTAAEVVAEGVQRAKRVHKSSGRPVRPSKARCSGQEAKARWVQWELIASTGAAAASALQMEGVEAGQEESKPTATEAWKELRLRVCATLEVAWVAFCLQVAVVVV